MVTRVHNLKEKESLSVRNELIVSQLAGDLERLNVIHKKSHFEVTDLIDDGDQATEKNEQDEGGPFAC